MDKTRKKNDRRSTVKALDKVTAEIIKIRDNRQCQRCSGLPGVYGCHWAHIYSRKSFILRWDLLNSLTLCAGCHRWGHGNPLDFVQFFKNIFPARYNYLIVKRRESRQVSTVELQELLEGHKEKFKELKDETQTG